VPYVPQLWDGINVRFRSITSALYRGTDAVMMIFSIHDRWTYDCLPT
jgi:GTPase SAR1 family protein